MVFCPCWLTNCLIVFGQRLQSSCWVTGPSSEVGAAFALIVSIWPYHRVGSLTVFSFYPRATCSNPCLHTSHNLNSLRIRCIVLFQGSTCVFCHCSQLLTRGCNQQLVNEVRGDHHQPKRTWHLWLEKLLDSYALHSSERSRAQLCHGPSNLLFSSKSSRVIVCTLGGGDHRHILVLATARNEVVSAYRLAPLFSFLFSWRADHHALMAPSLCTRLFAFFGVKLSLVGRMEDWLVCMEKFHRVVLETLTVSEV